MKARRLRISTWASRVFCIITLGDITPTPAYGAADLQKHFVSMHFTRSTLRQERRMYQRILFSVAWYLGYRISSWSRVYDLCEEGKDIATYIGSHLSAATVWDDLKRMQRYGNNGAHAHCIFLVI